MANVKVENVTKKYGSLVALNNVSFQCEEGEFFTLLGPSGAGKTTMLETIAGIKKVNSGNIYLDGHPVNDVPPQDRNVAMAFENYALYSHFSVYENIAFPLRSPRMAKKLSPEEEKAKVEDIANLLGIGHLLLRKPQQLSGGQKQRVSLARTMVRVPEVYLLDEPIAHLDAKLRTAARATLKRLAKKFGTTIIYVTHNYREALALSDRILVLRDGHVEQIDTPENLYHNPASDFVARLLGDPPINLIDGDLVTENGATVLRANSDFTLPIRGDLVEEAQARAQQGETGPRVRIGIRPQNMTVSRERISDASFQLPVYAVVNAGESSVVTFELKESFMLVKTETEVPYDVGDRLWIDIDQDHMYFFAKTMQISK